MPEWKPTTEIRAIPGGARVVPLPDAETPERFEVWLGLSEEPDSDWEELFGRNAYKAPGEPEGEVAVQIVSPRAGGPAIVYKCSEGLVERVRERISEWIETSNSDREERGEIQAREEAEATERQAERLKRAAELQERLNRLS